MDNQETLPLYSGTTSKHGMSWILKTAGKYLSNQSWTLGKITQEDFIPQSGIFIQPRTWKAPHDEEVICRTAIWKTQLASYLLQYYKTNPISCLIIGIVVIIIKALSNYVDVGYTAWILFLRSISF